MSGTCVRWSTFEETNRSGCGKKINHSGMKPGKWYGLAPLSFITERCRSYKIESNRALHYFRTDMISPLVLRLSILY